MPSSLTRVIPRALEFSSRLPVSVSGTGTFAWLEAFLGSVSTEPSVLQFSLPITAQPFRCTDLPMHQPRCLDGLFHPPASLPSCVTPSLIAAYGGTGISTCCPSATPFGLTLGPDLPWADEPSPGNLRLSADRILTCLFVTHTGILTCMQSTSPSGLASARHTTLPYPSLRMP